MKGVGYVEGKNIAVEWRRAEGRPEPLLAFAAELTGLQPAAIVTAGDLPIRAVRQATTTPIVAGSDDRCCCADHVIE